MQGGRAVGLCSSELGYEAWSSLAFFFCYVKRGIPLLMQFSSVNGPSSRKDHRGYVTVCLEVIIFDMHILESMMCSSTK